ncbi:unnamed protein product [Calicophoron daubneyi]|uniref:Unc-50-like protein n=1 Tax=Calicophoron daubneyi TaxID=300641 RepID=A0AAV2TIZ8_CALDB
MSSVQSVTVKVPTRMSRSLCSGIFDCSRSCQPISATRILSATEKISRYFRRLVHVRHMDFQYACWQMLNLIFAPQKVFRNFQYRNRSRRQWARDDPAFFVLMGLLVIVSSSIFAWFTSFNVLDTVLFVFWIVVFEFISVALMAATFMWILSNHYLVEKWQTSSSDILTMHPTADDSSDVEWGYAFDIHLNAFFPIFVIQFFLLPLRNVLVGFLGLLVGNSFWLLGALYYSYITFLGYSAVPFLRRTTILLWPMTGSVLLFFLSLAIGWNFTDIIWQFYRFQFHH